MLYRRRNNLNVFQRPFKRTNTIDTLANKSVKRRATQPACMLPKTIRRRRQIGDTLRRYGETTQTKTWTYEGKAKRGCHNQQGG